MKKFAKMSLVAAIAVAGMTSANAKDLTEAIKDVDVSGTVVYRYNDYSNGVERSDNSSTSQNSNNYQVALNVSSKVNDDIKANTRFKMGDVSLDTRSQGDDNVQVELTEVNFTYTGVENLSVTLGKQAISTPWTVDRDALGNESTGTGLVSSYTAGPVTLVGAYFNQTNLGETIQSEFGSDDNGSEDGLGTAHTDKIGANDIYVVGAVASFGGVSLDAFYTDMTDEFDAYTLGLEASYTVGSVTLSPFARYSALDFDNTNTDIITAITAEGSAPVGDFDAEKTQELWQIGMGAKMGIFSAFAAYGESGKDGGLVYLDSGSKVNMDYHWRATADGSADTEYLYVNATADVTEKINVGLFYSDADYKVANEDYNEIYVQAKYQMSSNLYTYVRLGQLDSDGSKDDQDMGRVHVQYSF